MIDGVSAASKPEKRIKVARILQKHQPIQHTLRSKKRVCVTPNKMDSNENDATKRSHPGIKARL